ncbi:MAG TPA: glycoside hydrolase family 95 protein [Candidatus Aminicenantes bacterium]|nr:MAG: alpha-L-fucosidase [Candidatus Aminicenantes bacterium]HEK85437.1 glycoside hydrolase family 95 protein [Candidatus Aminicenantes bacterium]
MGAKLFSKDEAFPRKFNPTTVIWYEHPADKWENAFPVGNGRLGAMVFGKTDEERIQLNEETYWSGGPYDQTRKGGKEHLAEIQKLIFEGDYLKAHYLFGRYLMGYPVEQQKYQSLANLILSFETKGDIHNYIHELDLDSAVVTTSYEQNGISYKREVFSSPIDQVIVVRIEASQPGAISFRAELRGCRNQAHSNYATDYFQMGSYGPDGLILTGKSADYLGVPGKIRYVSLLKAITQGGELKTNYEDLTVKGASSVTLYISAATNFVSYKDLSADPMKRAQEALEAALKKDYQTIKTEHLAAHRQLFRRVTVDFSSTENSFLPTDVRIKNYDGQNDPNLAGLVFQFGRYLLICSSRPGTQPANLQGIWNESMNPAWDSKYTTNINLEMNYWPAEVANLSECTEPLFKMIKELTDQGSEVAREHYGCRGWVFHQNTDIWRVAAPMDGPDWGAFTTGGAWLCTHLWEHYLYTKDKDFLAEYYPVMKGNVEFFLDFLVQHPRYGWLVTNPSTSPENFPDRPGNISFFDEVTGSMSPGTTLCAGSTIDLEILNDLFGYVAEASKILGVDEDFRKKVLEIKAKLAPLQINKKGELQEWLEDWGQKEKSHRHISPLYGLYPGNQISLLRTPQLAQGARAVLEQRGLTGNGWSSAWKMACWARLHEPEKAMDNFLYYLKKYTFNNLFAICSNALQVDGSFGMTAAIAEMLLQSNEGFLDFLPSLPATWSTGRINGLVARGGFEVNLEWENGKLKMAEIMSKKGDVCRIKVKPGRKLKIVGSKGPVSYKKVTRDLVEFKTRAGEKYFISSQI